MSLDRRLQGLIDDERYRRLTEIADERGVSVATVVREAIDRGLANIEGRRSAAGRRVLDAADTPVPDPAELEADDANATRAAARQARVA